MPVPPKHPSARARRNRSTTAATLKADPDLEAPPLPPRSWDEQTLAWWADVWASPMAPEYDDSDKHGLIALAVLVDDFWTADSPRLRRDLAGEIRLQTQRFGGAVDVVGGKTLAQILPQLAYGSSLAACGLAGGTSFETTVFPFILRAVSLVGIDSVYTPRQRREAAWKRLSRDLSKEALAKITHVASLEDVPRLSEEILQGKVQGRTVIAVRDGR